MTSSMRLHKLFYFFLFLFLSLSISIIFIQNRIKSHLQYKLSSLLDADQVKIKSIEPKYFIFYPVKLQDLEIFKNKQIIKIKEIILYRIDPNSKRTQYLDLCIKRLRLSELLKLLNFKEKDIEQILRKKRNLNFDLCLNYEYSIKKDILNFNLNFNNENFNLNFNGLFNDLFIDQEGINKASLILSMKPKKIKILFDFKDLNLNKKEKKRLISELSKIQEKKSKIEKELISALIKIIKKNQGFFEIFFKANDNLTIFDYLIDPSLLKNKLVIVY